MKNTERLVRYGRFEILRGSKGRWENTNQMPETALNHELKCFGCTGSIPSDHRIPGHNLADNCSTWIQSFGSHLISRCQRPYSTTTLYDKLLKEFTLYAKSLAVKIPIRPSSSSTTRTQSVRLAAHNWLASATVILSGTVNAWLGFRAATVPFWAALPFPPFLLRLLAGAVEIVRFLASSDPIFFRRAYNNKK
jgi:hypothetical protein